MRTHRQQFGLTLTELTVTIAVMAILMTLAVPAAKRLTSSLQGGAGARGMISAAMSNARAIAVRHGTYAGVRFQRTADGRTYMIYIVHDFPATGLANGFRAVEGRKPVALPEDIGVVDGFWVQRTYENNAIKNAVDVSLKYADITGGIAYLENRAFEDAATFSIVFSPAGKIVTRLVQVRRRNAGDTLFNTLGNPAAMFLQDDYDGGASGEFLGIGPENSRRQLIIYNKKDLAQVNASKRWSAYLECLPQLMVSPYTGELLGE